MNKKSNNRRAFLKQGALLGGGWLLVRPNPQQAMAEEKPKDPAQGQAQPANETLKTIRRLRTIHGNFQDKPLPETALQTILQASVRAANTSNMQNYSIVVVEGRTIPALSGLGLHAMVAGSQTDGTRNPDTSLSEAERLC